MAISAQTKRALNTLVPVSAAGIAGYMAYRSKARWQVLAVVVVLAFILSLVLTKQLTRIVVDITDRPPVVNIPQGTGGGISTDFDADRWATLLRDDVYNIFSFRNTKIYQQVAAMNESQLAAIGNAWNRLYYSEHQESLPQAIEAEWFGFIPFPYPDQIVSRLRTIGFV